MDASRILIVGANGQFGTALRQHFPDALATSREELDVTSPESINKFDWSKVDIIINASGYTKVDEAETAEGRIQAWKINGDGVRNLVDVAIKHDLTLVHISTDYVFDGSEKTHTEDEPLSPLGVYGQTKAAGDLLASLVPKHYILRVSWVIGSGGNFVRSIFNLGPKQISPNVVADQFGRLTFTTEIVRAAEHLLTKQPTYGTYNVSNEGDVVSWADVARQIYEDGGYTKAGLSVGDTTAAEYFAGKVSSPRPVYSGFDLSKLEATGFTPRDWRENLAEYIKNELE